MRAFVNATLDVFERRDVGKKDFSEIQLAASLCERYVAQFRFDTCNLPRDADSLGPPFHCAGQLYSVVCGQLFVTTVFRINMVSSSSALKWRQYVSPKRWYLLTSPHFIVTQTSNIVILTTVRNSHLTNCSFLLRKKCLASGASVWVMNGANIC
jgi:hypothetical protein